MKRLLTGFLLAHLLFRLSTAEAQEFESLGDSIAAALGTQTVFRTTVSVDGRTTPVFYSKDGAGKALKLAVVREELYEPNCAHTFVVGLVAKSARVTAVRLQQAACPHASPINSHAFLDQYKGRGPASLASLKDDIHTVAKATGSSDLATKAVVFAIRAASELKGKK